MKLALCMLFCLASMATADRHPVDDKLDELKQKFPKEEWQTFWNKLTDSLGEERTQFMEKLEQNQGNMQMTLAEFRDKMQGDYPIINEYYERVQDKWNAFNAKLNELTVADVINAIIEKLHRTFGDVNTGNPSDWWESGRAALITFYNRVQHASRGNYRARREIEGTLNNLEEAFPKQEWTSFWTKLTEALGDQKEEFMQKLQENEGNMRMTLAQFREKMEDDYPAISSAWETIQTKYDRVGQILKTTTVSDAINWAKNKFQNTIGVNSVEIGDGSQLYDSARAYLISFYNQLNSGRSHHRVRRSEAQVNQALDEVEQKFPKAEWDAFWNKLTDTLGDKRNEFQTQLESNQGNMDMTLTQYKDQLQGQYPQLREKWDQVQTQYNVISDKLKTLKLSDVVDWLKTKIQMAENQADNVNADEWWQQLRTFIITSYNKIAQQQTYYW